MGVEEVFDRHGDKYANDGKCGSEREGFSTGYTRLTDDKDDEAGRHRNFA